MALAGKSANNISLVLKFVYGRTRLLLPGDIEELAENRLVGVGGDGGLEPTARMDLGADILKVPHHGSKTSSTGAFLDAVSPSLAVISCGKNNFFGHPDPGVILRLRDRHVRIVQTQDEGSLVYIVKPDGWRRVVPLWRRIVDRANGLLGRLFSNAGKGPG